MKPFKTYYARETENWLPSHPGRIVSGFQTVHLLGQAYMKAGTMQIAVSGFRATRNPPFYPDIFTESDFLASAREQEAANEEANINRGPLVSPRDIVPVSMNL
jgi:hypothetical protein